MEEISFILIIATFFVFLFALGDQIRRVENAEVKKLLRKTADAHTAVSGLFDEPGLVIIGLVIASFYTLQLVSKIVIQGKLLFLIKTLRKEKEFLKRFILMFSFGAIGTTFAYYSRFLEYMILGGIAIIIVVIMLLIDRTKGCRVRDVKEQSDDKC